MDLHTYNEIMAFLAALPTEVLAGILPSVVDEHEAAKTAVGALYDKMGWDPCVFYEHPVTRDGAIKREIWQIVEGIIYLRRGVPEEQVPWVWSHPCVCGNCMFTQ